MLALFKKKKKDTKETTLADCVTPTFLISEKLHLSMNFVTRYCRPHYELVHLSVNTDSKSHLLKQANDSKTSLETQMLQRALSPWCGTTASYKHNIKDIANWTLLKCEPFPGVEKLELSINLSNTYMFLNCERKSEYLWRKNKKKQKQSRDLKQTPRNYDTDIRANHQPTALAWANADKQTVTAMKKTAGRLC